MTLLKRLGECVRGARRIGLFAAVALAALLALVWLDGGSGQREAPAGKTELEARLESLLEKIDGTGDVSVMIVENADGSTGGAVVVSSGLDDIGTYLEVQSALRALLDVELSRVRIIGRQGAFGGGN